MVLTLQYSNCCCVKFTVYYIAINDYELVLESVQISSESMSHEDLWDLLPKYAYIREYKKNGLRLLMERPDPYNFSSNKLEKIYLEE